MNLKAIISISGMNGLYKMISKTKSTVIVENIMDHKRIPVFALNSVSALEEVTVYTESGTIPLKDIFMKMFEKEKGDKSGIKISDSNSIKKYFSEVLPEYNKEKVYVSDMKKIIHWYNTLHEAGMLKPEEISPAEKPADPITSETQPDAAKKE